MIYTDKTKKAIKLCFEAHAGQKDKSGLPYAHHPLHLADQMDDEVSTLAALLHDVVEDTPYTFDDLEQMGFGDEVIAALRLLTHEDGVPYLDYVRAIAKNPVARKVKLADLAHNSDLSRLDHEPTEKDLERVRKYQKAREILLEENTSEAENKFKSGDIVQHFKREMLSDEEKQSNKYLYEIVGVATHSETREPMMVYKPLYDDCGMYVRPLEMFLGEVDHEKYPDIQQKYRFEKAGE